MLQSDWNEQIAYIKLLESFAINLNHFFINIILSRIIINNRDPSSGGNTEMSSQRQLLTYLATGLELHRKALRSLALFFSFPFRSSCLCHSEGCVIRNPNALS